ncbi:J domain-containing protein [Marinobacter nauticus]|nr:J domain-containing protein [Marinobacter nauticus]MCC4272031.1 J domain-containing protein [Marinobacter nauticus]
MNCWDLLGIEPTGDQDRIRQAYERQLKFASGDEARPWSGPTVKRPVARSPNRRPMRRTESRHQARQTMIPDNSAMKTLIPGR